ncbi:MAG: ATP-binding protein, partial [Candidatus Cloacimonetes bacterium]|nr:ATP-binding protein [Candidatus Cloacimonadota bacterium]
ISQLKKLQEKITHIETLAALGEMAANVAHEIRNPLSGIGGFAGLLDRQLEPDDPKKQFVKPIIEGVSRLNNIVSNLLTFTKPQQIKPNRVNINDTISEIIDFFSFSLKNEKKNIEIITDFDSEDSEIYLDVQMFQQVLINLLKNASEAVDPENGIIKITTTISVPLQMSDILDEDEKDELTRMFSFVEIQISDNGCGMDDSTQNKLFSPFFTTKDDGNGLGLAICKKIIQLHKGDIFVTSQPGEGTTFSINLPLYEKYVEN